MRRMSGRSTEPLIVSRCVELPDHLARVSQTARPLWIAQVARALSGLNARVDVVNDGGALSSCHSAHRPHRVPEAITQRRHISSLRLLIDRSAHLVKRERLLTVGRKIHHRTGWCSAKPVFDFAHGPQTDRQQRLDRLALHNFACLTTVRTRAGLMDSGRRQIANCLARF